MRGAPVLRDSNLPLKTTVLADLEWQLGRGESLVRSQVDREGIDAANDVVAHDSSLSQLVAISRGWLWG